MTTMNLAREAIIGRMQTVFGVDPFWVCPWFPDSESDGGQVPSGVSDDGTVSYARLSIRETIGGQETLGPPGARRYKRNGVTELYIYAVANFGTLKADELVALFRGSFEGVSFGGLSFTDCNVVDLGVEGVWWRVNALARFWFDETK